MGVLFFTLFYFLSESFKKNVLCILKKTLKRSILRAPVKAFGLLVKKKKDQTSPCKNNFTSNPDMMPKLWHKMTEGRTKVVCQGWPGKNLLSSVMEPTYQP